MASTVEPEQLTGHCQHVLVMRHSDRADDYTDHSNHADHNFDESKPWDAPLTNAGRIKALETGKKLQAELRFPIHRIITSPFRRCIETARELIAGLSTEGKETTNIALDDGNSADSSTSGIKVSIEYGMSEVFNDVAMWYHPTDRDSWGFDIKKLETSFPPGVVDLTPHRVFKELPQWGESESRARDRYLRTIHYLVDKYPQENLLFVTHADAVRVVVSTYWKEARGHDLKIGYRGSARLKRQIIRNGDSFTANKFEIATDPEETGIKRKPIQYA
ncbi:hypothetical protein ACJRO7_020335 [Eucalyptus globulus]|uniref:Uncharacterized protein n=1 Tax=Eucalyptus globulus TaxID=34317 RepID=A0ABD3KHU9_EUCGL